MKFNTNTGEYYSVDSNGCITRGDRPGMVASGQWRFLGLQHVKRNEFIPLADIASRLPDLTLRYKNGKPQYTVRDFDHGTVRQWGNRGIASIWDIS